MSKIINGEAVGAREELQRDPTLAILPSGKLVSLRGIQVALPVEESALKGEKASVVIKYFGDPNRYQIDGTVDVAALRAALGRIGVTLVPPTTKGSDADGDGIVGEGS